jgi:hypothetical protein
MASVGSGSRENSISEHQESWGLCNVKLVKTVFVFQMEESKVLANLSVS